MNDENTVIVPASDLLRQWREMASERAEKLDSRNLGFGGPLGIDETLGLLRADMSATMWFLDKTLKLLAAQSAKPADADERCAQLSDGASGGKETV